MLNLIILFVGKLVIKISQLFNLGSGSTWPGHIALKFNNKFIEDVINKNKSLKIIVIAGTNGKTTSTALLKFLLEKSGHKVFTNNEGANLLNGVASTIIKNSNIFSQLKYDYAIFESDELNLPLLLKKISPDKILILNLFRDQLDRYGEVNTIVLKWLKSLKILDQKTEVFINGDDPQLYYIGSKLIQKVQYFGIEKKLMKLKDIPNDVDSIYCPVCLSLLKYNQLSYAHLGDFYCPNCQFKRGEIADFSQQKILYPMEGLYNVYNTNAVLLLVKSLISVENKNINQWLKTFSPVFGRQEEIIYKKRKVFILLSKNPAGFNQSIQTVKEILKNNKANFLIVLNDRIPDGQDVSWIWDVDFKPIFDVAKSIAVSGDRFYDMNLRLRYEDDTKNILTFESLSDAIGSVVNNTREEERLYILPTYSPMLEVRKILLGRKLL
jgi:lipid II isoglutaminyl synthase (glutamine-hydrolysing)